MITIQEKKECCGCNACAQICPRQCIDMVTDKEGFKYPHVDYDKCIKCGLCNKVCPILNSNSRTDSVFNAYVSYCRDNKIRSKSSSGGMFYLFAEYILTLGGVVFGAAFDNNFNVHHVGVHCIDDLPILMGSKYVQSNIENTFCEVRKELEKGSYVLYSGTECQIEGLKLFLKRNYEKLYTIDVLCHGVPSPKLWEQYINEQRKKYNSEIKSISFRTKTEGWRLFSMKIEFENGKIYDVNLLQDVYLKLFLNNICLRPSCYDCKYKKLERKSDITIGDCWGIENTMPDMDDNNGASIVIIHTEKGQKIFDLIGEKMRLKKVDVEMFLPKDMDSRKSVIIHPKRDIFFDRLNKEVSVYKLVKLVMPSLRTKLKRKLYKMVRVFLC